MFLLEASEISLILYLFGMIIICLVIFGFLMKWIFRTNEVADYQRATVWLLIFLCKKNKVPDEQIEEIKRAFKIK